MALKLIIDKLEDVAEALRPLYEEKDGKWHLAVDGIEDNSGLKSALVKERKAASDLARKVKQWEALGKTTEQIEEMIAAAAKAEEDKLHSAGEWDKLKAQMNAKHEEALKALMTKSDLKDGELKAMRGSLERHLIDAQATAAIAAHKGVPLLLLPHVQKHVKVVEDNGEFSVKVVDAKGDPRVNGKGDPLSISDFVAEMRGTEIFGRAFEGSGQAGGGMPPGNGGGGTSHGVKRRSDLKTEKERADFVDTQGIAAYQQLPA